MTSTRPPLPSSPGTINNPAQPLPFQAINAVMTPTTPKPKLSAVRKDARQRLKALKKSGGLKKSKAAAADAEVAKPPAKKRKLRADELPWKQVKTSTLPGIDAGGGMMMLEELDGVGVEWEEQEDGRKVARFVTRDETGKKRKHAVEEESEGEDDGEEWLGIDGDAAPGEDREDVEDEDDDEEDEDEEEDGDLPTFAGLKASELDDEDSEEDEPEPEPKFDLRLLPAWAKIPLHAGLKKALLALGFVNPTEIQKQAVPLALQGRDIVGVAETGSGKTLAYSLPVLSYLLRQPPPRAGKKRALSALVLCPTRELAIQVNDHLSRVVASVAPASEGTSKVPRISIGTVVGGLSAHKQRRILDRGCDILVATPGRLWDLVKTDDELAASLRTLRFLIVDEADRMIENGHFAELEHIVQLSRRQLSSAEDVGEDEDPVFAQMATQLTSSSARDDLQTFVFSATLSKDLQANLKRRNRKPLKKKGKKASTLDDLVSTLDFRDADPAIVDLSPKGNKVSTLREAMVESVLAEKDLYLYYFLLRYPGRTLVFVGSIDGIRRLVPLLEQLRLPVFPLHSQLQQKQRLRNLDRFKASPDGVLIATDVAARGLDIPSVDHVVHFNLPRTADAYVHRSGRTARAQNPGFALQIVSPEDKAVQRALLRSLGRPAPPPDLQVDGGFLPKLKERLALAREIEGAQHRVKKEAHDRNWILEAAEAMDIDLEPDMLSDFEDDDPDAPVARRGGSKKGRKQGKAEGKVDALKAKLGQLLDQPLIARGVSTRYPTSGSRVIVDDVLAGKSHVNMLGAGTETAYEVADRQASKPRPRPKAKAEEQPKGKAANGKPKGKNGKK